MATRRERDAQQMKINILSAANEISKTEGYEAISIRKIAQRIDYTPSLIYHYFANKEEIVSVLLQEGYKKLTTSLAAAHAEKSDPREKLQAMTKAFLHTALEIPQEFSIVHMDSSPLVVEHTGYLFKGAAEKRLALRFIIGCIQDMHQDTVLDADILELAAQSIAAATLGLALKLIVEKNLPKDQQETLITYFSDVAVIRMARIGN